MALNINNLIPKWLKKKEEEPNIEPENTSLGFSSIETGPTPSAGDPNLKDFDLQRTLNSISNRPKENIKEEKSTNIVSDLGNFLNKAKEKVVGAVEQGKQYIKDEEAQSEERARKIKSGETTAATLQSEISDIRAKLNPIVKPVVEKSKDVVKKLVEVEKERQKEQTEYWRIMYEEKNPEKAKEYKTQVSEERREKLITDIESLSSKKDENKLDIWDKAIDIIDRPEQLVPFVSSGADAKKFSTLLIAANKFNNGNETEEDLKLLQDYVSKSEMDKTFGYNVLDVISMMPSFAGELYTTAGIATVSRTAAKKTAKEVLEKLLSKNGKKLLKTRLAKFSGKAGAEIIARTAQTPVAGGARIAANTIERQVESTLSAIKQEEAAKLFGDEEFNAEVEDWWDSAVKSFGEQWVETVSEFSGGVLKPLSKPIKNKLLKTAFFSVFKKTNPTAKVDDLAKIVNKMGYNGVLGEMFEEQVAMVGHGTLNELGLGDQEFRLPTGEELATQLVAFSVPGVAVSVMNKLDPTLNKTRKIIDDVNVGLSIEDVSSKNNEEINSIITLPKKERKEKINEYLNTNEYIIDTGGTILDDITTQTLNSSLALGSINRIPEILNTVNDGAFTDSFMLINDQDIANKLVKDVKKKLNLPDNIEGKAPDWQQLIPTEYSKNTTTIRGYSRDSSNKISVILDNTENMTIVDANRLAFMKKQLPNANIYLQEEGKPVVFEQNGEVKGLLMPIKTDESSFNGFNKEQILKTDDDAKEELAPDGYRIKKGDLVKEYLKSGSEYVTAESLDKVGHTVGPHNTYLTKISGEVAPTQKTKSAPLKFDDGWGKDMDKEDLKKAGIGVEAMGFDEHATVLSIDGKPAIGYSFLNGNLSGFSVAEQFRGKGIATEFIKDLLKDNNGTIKVEDANEGMIAVLSKVGDVSKPDGAGTVTVTTKPPTETTVTRPYVSPQEATGKVLEPKTTKLPTKPKKVQEAKTSPADKVTKALKARENRLREDGFVAPVKPIPEVGKIQEAIKTRPVVDDVINKAEENLINEIKKYKNEDDFFKDRKDIVYHGTQSMKNANNIRNIGFQTDKVFVSEYLTTLDPLYASGKPSRVVSALVKKNAKKIDDDTFDVYKPDDLIPLPKEIYDDSSLENYVIEYYDKLEQEEKIIPKVDKEVKQELKKAKGLSISDILKKYPNINLKKDVPIKDIHGDKAVIDKGEALTPYELKGNKVLLQDGDTYIVSKNQYQNLRGNAISDEAKEFAPELKDTETVIKGAENIVDKFKLDSEKAYNSLPSDVKKILDKYSNKEGDYEENDKMIKELEKVGWSGDYNLEGEMTELYRVFTKDSVESVKTNDLGQGYWVVKFKGSEDTVEFPLSKADDKAEAIDYAIKEMSSDTTKYSNYQLPDGKNYKEILIKAPTRDEGKYNLVKKQLGGLDYTVKEFDNVELARKELLKMNDNEYYIEPVNKSKNFKSAHWKEPNVLAHIRTNERKYKDDKVTFLEEIQSDWAREGRDKGFTGDKGRQVFDDYVDTLKKKYNTDAMIIDQKLLTTSEKVKYQELFDSIQDFGEGVPSNPLLKNWQELAIKKSLQEAVNNNSVYLAWTNGEQQSARYNLAKEVDNINWNTGTGINKTGDDKSVQVIPKSGSQINLVVNEKGIIIKGGQADWKGKNVSEAIGKGISEKIMDKPKGNLKGEGLKLGGEWATNLYDKQIKNIVEKITGGKVEILDMGIQSEKIEHIFRFSENIKKELSASDLKVGKDITDTYKGENYIITDVLGDGKFKAMPKMHYNNLIDKDEGKIHYDNVLYPDKKSTLDSYTETFDISTKKSKGQQAIKLTPEIKAKVKGEATAIKKPSGKKPAKIIEAIKKRPKPAIAEKVTKAISERPKAKIVDITRPPSLRKLNLKPPVSSKITTAKDGKIISNRAEDVELKMKLRKEAKAARLGYNKGSREAREKIITKLKETQTEIKDIKKQIIDYAKNNLPLSERGRLLNTVSRATTQRGLSKAFMKIDEIVDMVAGKKLTAEIKKTIDRITNSNIIAIDYKEKINSIMSGIEIPGHSQKTLDRLQGTKEYIEKQKDDGKDVSMPNKVMEALKILERKKWKDLSITEKELIIDKLEIIEQLGKTKWKALRNIHEMEKAKELDELVDNTFAIESSLLMKPDIGEKLTAKEKFKNVFPSVLNKAQKIDLALSPMDVFFDLLDGSQGYVGSNFKIFKKQLDSDFSGYLGLKDKYADQTWVLAKELGLDQGNFERIGAYAAIQQKGGKDKLIKNNGYTEEELDSIVLTKNEMDFYKTMQKNMDALLPLVTDYMKNVYNKSVKKEENYFPFHTDYKLLDEAEIWQRFGDVSTEYIETNRKTKKTAMGFVKERLGIGKQKIKINAMEIYQSHMDNATYMITMGKDIKRLSEIANTDEYGNVAGDFGQNMVQDWLDLMARKGGAFGAGQLQWLDTLRRNVGGAVLGFKLSSALIQPTALLDGMSMIGKYAPMGVNYVFTSPNQKEWQKFLNDNFEELKGRQFDDPSFTELAKNKTLAKIQEASFKPLKVLDTFTAASITAGAYKKYIDEHNIELDFENPNQKGITYAQRILRRTQASAFFKDIPLAISKGRVTGNISLDKALFQFQNFVINRWSLLRHDIYRVDLRLPDIGGHKYADKKRAYDKAAWKLTMIMLANIAAVGIRRGAKNLIDLLTGSDSPEDSWTKDAVDEVLTTIPFISQVMSMAMYGGGMFPVVDAIEDTVKEGYSVLTREGEGIDTKLRHFLNLTTTVAGAGVGVPGMVQLRQILVSMTYNIKDGDKTNKFRSGSSSSSSKTDKFRSGSSNSSSKTDKFRGN